MNELTREVLDFPGMEKDTPQYETIRSHYLFSGLDDSVFDALAADIAVETFEKGEILFIVAISPATSTMSSPARSN